MNEEPSFSFFVCAPASKTAGECEHLTR